MIRFFLLCSLFFVTASQPLLAVEDALLGFKIDFPEGPGWWKTDYKQSATGAEVWSSKNSSEGLTLMFMVATARSAPANPDFKTIAATWEKGIMANMSRKISSSFVTVSGREAFALICQAAQGRQSSYFAYTMVQSGARTYTVCVAAPDPDNLRSPTALAFIQSLSITK